MADKIIIVHETEKRPEVSFEKRRKTLALLKIEVLENEDGSASYYANVRVGDHTDAGTCGAPGMTKKQAIALARREASEWLARFIKGRNYKKER